MKKLNIFLLSITLLFASCSIISNPTEENNTKDNLALFTLNIGNSARTIYAAEYTEADLTDIKVTFTSKDTNKTVTALPTENTFSWRIPEGTYTVTVTANAKGYKLAGSASGVKVTKAEGGRATIRLSPSYEGFGNVEIKFLYESGEDTFYNNGIPTTTGSSNGLEPVKKIEDNNLSSYLVELKSASTNQKYTLELTNNGNGITARNTEPIPAGFYTLKFVIRSTTEVKRLCLPDNLVEITNDCTTRTSFNISELKNEAEDEIGPIEISLNFDSYYFNYRNGKLNNPDYDYPPAKYITFYNDINDLFGNTNGQSQTVHNFSYDYKGNRLYLINTDRKQVGIRSKTSGNMEYISFRAYDSGFQQEMEITNIDKIVAFDNTIYVSTQEKLYYGEILAEESGTIVLSEIHSEHTQYSCLAAYKEGLIICQKMEDYYYIEQYNKDNPINGGWKSIASFNYAENRYNHYMSDMTIIGDKLYFLIKEQFADESEHDAIGSHGALYVLDLSKESPNPVILTDDLTGSILHHDISEGDSKVYMLGPSRFLGISAINNEITLYIADEGYYCKGEEKTPSWSTRILSYTTSIDSTERKPLRIRKEFSTDPAENANHFETTYEGEPTPKFKQIEVLY